MAVAVGLQLGRDLDGVDPERACRVPDPDLVAPRPLHPEDDPHNRLPDDRRRDDGAVEPNPDPRGEVLEADRVVVPERSPVDEGEALDVDARRLSGRAPRVEVGDHPDRRVAGPLQADVERRPVAVPEEGLPPEGGHAVLAGPHRDQRGRRPSVAGAGSPSFASATRPGPVMRLPARAVTAAPATGPHPSTTTTRTGRWHHLALLAHLLPVAAQTAGSRGSRMRPSRASCTVRVSREPLALRRVPRHLAGDAEPPGHDHGGVDAACRGRPGAGSSGSAWSGRRG